MSARTEAIEAEGWRLERWWRESLNAATFLQETGIGLSSVGSRIVLAKYLVADNQIGSVFRCVKQLEIDSISNNASSLSFDETHRFLSSQNPRSDGDRDLVNEATTQHAPVQRTSSFQENLPDSEVAQDLEKNLYRY